MIDSKRCNVNEKFFLSREGDGSEATHQNRSEALLMCGLLRCQISAGCDELRTKNSWAMCAQLAPFWRFGMERAGGWWSMLLKVVYVISCSAWIAFRTSMLSVATSWWSVETCVSRRSTEFLMFAGFSSFTSSCTSSSDTLSWMTRLLLFMLTGLLFTLGVRLFRDFSLSAMRVWRLRRTRKFIYGDRKVGQTSSRLTSEWACCDVLGWPPILRELASEWYSDDAGTSGCSCHPPAGSHRLRWWTAVPGSVRCSPTPFPLRSPHVDCTSSRVEYRWQILADIPDTALGLLSVRICEYIWDHNRLTPESAWE